MPNNQQNLNLNFCFKHLNFKKLTSTHQYAIENIDTFSSRNYAITTETQTSGIGRKGDQWLSGTRGESLALTFVITIPHKNLPELAHILAYSIFKVLSSFGLRPLFKWPNDLLVNEKKIAGIMCDIKYPKAICSVGLNINSFHSMPGHTISLMNAGVLTNASSLQSKIEIEFKCLLTRYFKEGFQFIQEALNPHLAHLNKLVKIDNIKGFIKELNSDGRLILKLPDKTTTLISSGTIKLEQ